MSTVMLYVFVIDVLLSLIALGYYLRTCRRDVEAWRRQKEERRQRRGSNAAAPPVHHPLSFPRISLAGTPEALPTPIERLPSKTVLGNVLILDAEMLRSYQEDLVPASLADLYNAEETSASGSVAESKAVELDALAIAEQTLSRTCDLQHIHALSFFNETLAEGGYAIAAFDDSSDDDDGDASALSDDHRCAGRVSPGLLRPTNALPSPWRHARQGLRYYRCCPTRVSYDSAEYIQRISL